MTASKFDYDFTLPSVVQRISSDLIKKKRNFPGSMTSRGFGPVNAPAVASGDDNGIIATGGYETAADPVSVGVTESNETKFKSFLESLETPNNKELLGIVKEGFEAFIETKK